MQKILITPRSFGKHSNKPFELLKQKGYELRINPYGRILTQEEMIMEIADVDGIIVGVDPLNAEVLKNAKKLKVYQNMVLERIILILNMRKIIIPPLL